MYLFMMCRLRRLTSKGGRHYGLIYGAALFHAFCVCSLFAQSNTVEIEPNGTPPTATQLPLSANFGAGRGALGVGDSDYFKFLAPAGAKTWLLVDTGGAENPPFADSVLTLLDSSGTTVLEEDDDDGTGNGCDDTVESRLSSAIAGHSLPSAGTYYAAVRAYDSEEIIDAYKLFVVLTTLAPTPESEPNETPGSANTLSTMISPLGLRSGLISSSADADVYSVSLLTGSVLFVSADCDPNREGGIDLAIDLIGTNGATVLLTANSSSNEVAAAEAFCYTTSEAGTYYVRVRSLAGATGAYQLMGASRGPGTFQFSAATFTRSESSGATMLPVLRTGGSLGEASVLCTTSNGSAIASNDYTAISQLLTFPDGVITQFITLSITEDALVESNETFRIQLSMPTAGATVGVPGSALIVVLDNDENPHNTSGTAIPLDVADGFAMTELSPQGVPLWFGPGDQDWFSFSAPSGATLWALLDTGGGQNPEGNSRDSVLTLYAGDGRTVLEEDDDDGSGSGCSFNLPPDGGGDSAIGGRALIGGGTFYLRARPFLATDTISPYSLFLALTGGSPDPEAEPNNTPGFAEPLVTASIATAERLAQIGAVGDVDYYSIIVPSNSFIFVNADCDPGRDGSSTDLRLEFLAANASTVLFTADSSGTEPAAAEAFCLRLTEPGTYFLRVSHSSGEGTGPYRIMATRSPRAFEPNDGLSSAVPLNVFNRLANVPGEISPGGDVDYYSLFAVPGARLWATIDTGGIQAQAANSRDSLLTLLAADGETIIEQDDNDGSATGRGLILESGEASAIAGRSLVSGGNYYLRVAAATDGAVIAPYTLFVVVTTEVAMPESEANNTPATANALLTAAPRVGLRSGVIGAPGDVDLYSIFAFPGDLFHISADGDPERDGLSTDLRLDLLGSNGMVLFSADSSGSGDDPAAEAFCFQAPSAGVYFIRVAEASGSMGSYQLLAARDRVPLRISSVARNGVDLRVSFPTEPGRNYQVEFLDTLRSPRVWAPLSGVIEGSGETMSAVDVGAAARTNRFYQLRLLP